MESMANAVHLQNLHPLTLVLALVIFWLSLYKWMLTQTPARKKLPPSPWRLPVIGNIHQLTTSPQRGLHALSRSFGDIMMLQLGVKRVLVVSSARSASHVMKTHDVAFASRQGSGVFRRMFYNGRNITGAPYGEYWRQMKSVIVLRLLSNSRVRSYSEVRKEEVSEMVGKIKGLLGREVDLSEVLMGLTNDVVCRVVFGEKYDAEEKSGFRRLLRDFGGLVGGFWVSDFFPWLGWIDKVSGLDRRVERVKREFDEFFEGVVRQHEERFRDGINDRSNMDFVDVLLQIQRDRASGFPFERDSIKAIILDTFIAGTESIATVLEWTMTELLKHPRSMKALQDEVRRINRQSITEEDAHQMKYLKATIKETMRLHPPNPLLVPRESTREVELDGYTIPEGTQVIANVWAIQRDPAVWVDPDEFRPERFLLDSCVDLKGQHFELIPFGAGRRGCPGIQFSMAAIELALANLVGLFDWGLPRVAEPESLDREEAHGITIHRHNPLVVVPFLP